jgi:hypothetical protein
MLRVVLLTLQVGNSTEFLRKVANDWGTVIQAIASESLSRTSSVRVAFAGSTRSAWSGLRAVSATMNSNARSDTSGRRRRSPFDTGANIS